MVNDFVDSILALDMDASVIVLGDLNDFQFSAPLATLSGGVLTNLIDTLPAEGRYTYIYDGNSQVLDQILVSQALLTKATAEIDILHLNAEFAHDNRPADHDPVLARFTFAERRNLVFLPLVLRAPVPTPTPTSTSTATPRPTSTPTATATSTSTATSTGTATLTPSLTHTPTLSPTATKVPTSQLLIAYLRYDTRDEYVRIENRGTASQTMTGWKIRSVVGEQRYSFPSGYVLNAGASVRVHSGPDAVDNPPGDLRWTTRYIWNNDGDKAELRDPSGTVVDSYCYRAGCP